MRIYRPRAESRSGGRETSKGRLLARAELFGAVGRCDWGAGAWALAMSDSRGVSFPFQRRWNRRLTRPTCKNWRQNHIAHTESSRLDRLLCQSGQSSLNRVKNKCTMHILVSEELREVNTLYAPAHGYSFGLQVGPDVLVGKGSTLSVGTVDEGGRFLR